MGGYTFIYVVLGLLILQFLRHLYLQRNPHKTEEAEYFEQVRKQEVTRLVETRSYREDLSCVKDEEFWSLVNKAKEKAYPDYKSRLNLFRDYLSNKYTPEELIRFDNRYFKLIEEYISQDVLAAATIVFQEKSLGYAELMMNVFMMEGEIFFKNACINPNIIVGKSFDGIVPQTIAGEIADLYYRKTNHLIPESKEEIKEENLSGEMWDSRDLPRLYPQLWQEFA